MSDKYNQKWVSTVFRKERWAITLGQTTYYSIGESEVGPVWRAEEDHHKKQFEREGFFKYCIKYLWYNCTKGYKNNPYEIEAKAEALKLSQPQTPEV